jgi:hypothetical protein
MPGKRCQFHRTFNPTYQGNPDPKFINNYGSDSQYIIKNSNTKGTLAAGTQCGKHHLMTNPRFYF